MLRSKWLYVVGLAITAPIVVALSAAAINQFLSGGAFVGWRSGGRLPPGVTGPFEIYLIAAVSVCVWIVGLWKIIGMFRADKPRR